MWEDGAARAAQLLIRELVLQGTLPLVFLPYLFHLSEDSQQVSSKDTLKLFLTPATTQQLLYQYWVCGHVLQPLREPVWPPASQLLGLSPVPWS